MLEFPPTPMLLLRAFRLFSPNPFVSAHSCLKNTLTMYSLADDRYVRQMILKIKTC